MPWFYVDDAFADSKPVMRLHPSIRNEAVGLWLRCGAWSAKEETDGRVPRNLVRAMGGTPRIIRALIEDARLWAPGDCDENLTEFPPESVRISDEIVFKKWSKWQKTKAELLEKRREAAERQRRSRENRKPKGRNALTSEEATESRVTNGATVDVTEDPPPEEVTRDEMRDVTRESSRARARRPDPTRPLVETLGGEGHVTNGAALEEPSRRCPKHEDADDPPPCGACAEARRANDRWAEELANAQAAAAEEARRAELEEEAEARALAIARCSLGCDEDGYMPGGGICHHNPGQAETNRRGRDLVRAVMNGELTLPNEPEEDQ